MEKLFAFLAVFRKGGEVSDPAKWKTHQITANTFGGFILALVALAKAFNYDIPIDEDASMLIGGGIIAIVNVLLTMATSKKVGVGQVKSVEQPVEQPPVQSDSEADKGGPGSTYFG